MSVPQTLYITGISRPATENPISQRHRVLFLAFLVDAKTGTILEVQVEEMLHQVEARYWGHSRKSILVAIKQAHTKWINWSSGHRSPLS